MTMYKTIGVVSPYMHKMVYFAVPSDYDARHKSINQIYDDCIYFSTIKRNVQDVAIRQNIRNRQLED
jgi:hypothetical protein